MNIWMAFAVAYLALLLYFFLFPFRLSDYDDLDRARWRRCLLVMGAVLAGLFISSPFAGSVLARSRQQTSGRVRVWVNSRSGFYYCPGTQFYGRLQPGKYMTETDARQFGYQPSTAATCP